MLTQSLGGRLGAYAGMAGNDATSASFARAYDAGAPAALAALTDLTHAFIGAGRLLAATGSEHARAEAAAAFTVSAYNGGALDDSFVRIRPPLPPSSLGAQEVSLGRVDAWILDQVEGFVWPGGDVPALRSAATDWRRAASSADGLADQVDIAVAFLEPQRSPEVPVATDALGELRSVVLDTAWQLTSIATACDDYADAIEDTRERTRALLEEIGKMVVEGVAISAFVTAVSGGLGGGASAAAVVEKIREKLPRFVALLTALRASVATAAARLERVLDDLADLRARIGGWLRVPARDERGELKNPLGWFARDRKPGWLNDHEVPPGHTMKEHVGKTTDELAERLTDHPKLPQASTFADQATAERLIEAVLERRVEDIDQWIAAGATGRLTLVEEMGEVTGTSVLRDGTVTHPTGMRVVLVPDQEASTGWRILTSFPD
ncbi:hypothetical protein EUA93_10975 [Nocardioides oleivorans]|uniref:Bacterial CdiA-CT RNAse A domain-containing protein n=1 Tax=Nocardioides oleivorans TaxID=273676 RepID=A0A4Q2S0X9_9ACTN|nr:RNase A-like domain-containing protein [Nocardioides oleivorans]RYB94826.1 hypothetical protein EUA93_10975 [Nocardioides oleivorans]